MIDTVIYLYLPIGSRRKQLSKCMVLKQINYVINLESRLDRRAEMEKELSRIGWSAEFFPAIRPSSAADFPSIGARGCFLSHLAVLVEAEKTKAERIVILEDDVNFVDDFTDRWRFTMNALEERQWSIFYAGHILDGLDDGLNCVSSLKGVQCAHFMAIHRNALPSLIEGLRAILSRHVGHTLGGPMHVDGAYSTLRMQQPALITYTCQPTLGYQRSSRTDIGNLKWFDTIKALQPALKFARKLKSWHKR